MSSIAPHPHPHTHAYDGLGVIIVNKGTDNGIILSDSFEFKKPRLIWGQECIENE